MDIDILVWLAGLRGAWSDAFFGAITRLGGEIPIIAIACLVYWCLSKRAGDRLLLTLFSGILVNQFLKLTFCVARPWVRSTRVTPVESAVEEATGYSFPSGHTANAVAGYGGLAREKRMRKYAWALWALVALIAFSRCYLGVHTPQDVLVSLAIGVILLFCMERLARALERKPALDAYIALTGVLLALALAAYALFKPYPDGADDAYRADAMKLAGGAAGLFAGWLIERRRVGFTMPASFLRGAMRFILGMGLILGVMVGLKSPLNSLLGALAGGFTRYALVGLAATALWPWLFTKVRLL